MCHAHGIGLCLQMIVMLVVLLFLYDWKALSEMAVAHIAAATPRAGTSVDQSKSAFSRPTVEDGPPEAQLPPTPPPRSPRPQGGTTVTLPALKSATYDLLVPAPLITVSRHLANTLGNDQSCWRECPPTKQVYMHRDKQVCALRGCSLCYWLAQLLT